MFVPNLACNTQNGTWVPVDIRVDGHNPLHDLQMNAILKNVLTAAMVAAATQASAQITFNEDEAFEGRSFGTKQPISNFKPSGFKDRASSAVVFGNRWEAPLVLR